MPTPPRTDTPIPRFSGIRVTRDHLNEHARRVPLDVPEVTLDLVYSRAGSVKRIPMTREDLVHIILGAADALRILDLHAAAHTLDHQES